MSYKKGLFQGVPKKNPNKSRFNLSHEWKSQIQPGWLIPCLNMETMPGDNWEIDTEFMFRFSPLYFPVMHKFTMRADYYYTPYRILWNQGEGANVGWKKWIAEQEEIIPPQFSPNMRYLTGGFNNNILSFMGLPMIPLDGGHTLTINNLSAFPLSAILKIWDEYERNPQLEAERWFNLTSGDNTANFLGAFAPWVETASPIIMCLPAKWEKDYLTSALPQPQIGDAINIPTYGLDEDGNPLPTVFRRTDNGAIPLDGTIETVAGEVTGSNPGTQSLYIAEDNAPIIKQIRIAEVLQSFYERIMKVGTRYRDFIEGLYGNDPEPMAVDVPVLMGSKFGRVQVADVMTQAYTAPDEFTERRTGDYTGQMNMYENNSGRLHYNCKEHGIIICILQVNANTSYGQGIERFWRRELQTDYPLDMFSGIGDQEILKEEVVYNPMTANLATNQETFGYIPRFSEMRYKNNIQVGQLNWTQGLSQHAGRIFGQSLWSNPDELVIDDNFVSVYRGEEPTRGGDLRLSEIWRILPGPVASDPGEGTIYAHIFHSVYVNRALPMYSTPSIN